MIRIPLLLALLATCFLSASMQKGCKGAQSAASGPPRPATETRSVDDLQKKLAQRSQEMKAAQSLTARARLSTSGESGSISASVNIIWIRDSIIWINAKKFGFEAMRALVTRDSAFVLNRLEKSLTAQSLESLRYQYHLPDGDPFDVLQKTLLGLPGIDFKASTTKSNLDNEMHRLKADLGSFWGTYHVEEGSFLLKNAVFLQKRDNSTGSIQFNKHQKAGNLNALFPFYRRVDTSSPDSGQQTIEIDFESVDFNTRPSYRFEIPEHYSKN